MKRVAALVVPMVFATACSSTEATTTTAPPTAARVLEIGAKTTRNDLIRLMGRPTRPRLPVRPRQVKE